MALNGLKGSDKSHVWIEIKSTGLNDLGQLNNSFRYLFQKDFSALRRDNKIGSSDNYGYWAWMYLFDYAREKVEVYVRSRSTRTDSRKHQGSVSNPGKDINGHIHGNKAEIWNY